MDRELTLRKANDSLARAAAILFGITGLALALAVAFDAAFAARFLGHRILVYGEAEPLHEAIRLRAGLPLYTDPIAGAFDQGPFPSRTYVVYPPLWSWILSLLPGSFIAATAQAMAGLVWFGSLAALAATAPSASRNGAWIAAAWTGGIWVVTIFATCGRPDAAAVALAGYAFARSVRAERIDVASGILFALAFWLKPNVLGLALGAGLVHLAPSPRRVLPALASGVLVSLAIVLCLHRASDGHWWEHFRPTFDQKWNLEFWWSQLSRRLLFAFPAFAALAVAWARRKTEAGRMALGGLAAAFVWAGFTLGKPGSASNYWMEPAMGAVAVVSSLPPLVLSSRARTAFAAALALHAVWLLVATAIGVLEAFEKEPLRIALLERARATCIERPGDVVLADRPGIEFAVNGRVLTSPFVMWHLAQSGRFPARVWADDVRRPEAQCIVVEGGDLETPPGSSGQFPAEVHAALRERFQFADEGGDFRLYRARDRSMAPALEKKF